MACIHCRVLLGAWFLKESFNLQRMVSAGIILCGVMALRLG